MGELGKLEKNIKGNPSSVKATIVIPVYNGETTIRRALESAIHQETGEPYEILVIDDGSRDRSPAIVDEYAKAYDWVRVIHQKNQGISRTREIAISLAKGNFIYWIDADDYADSRLLSRTLPLLDQGFDIVAFGVRYFYQNGKTEKEVLRDPHKTSEGWKRDTLNGQLSTLWGYVAKKNFMKEEKVPSDLSYAAEDGYINIRVFGKAEKITAIPDILYYHLEDSPYSIRHTISGRNYYGNASLWLYRLHISEKTYPENIRRTAARAFSGYVKAFCIDTMTHDLSEEEKDHIKSALRELKKYSIPGRQRDKFLAWAILNGHTWFCRKYAEHKNKKTEEMNRKIAGRK
ncbi:glycosyltransferase family 2 protein [uncultured Dialister sp.]|uniref:glycosyltransferase family 2 protein n=1 Tax=uncultured Dialister sp. TaxID=278064 RepID=UPI0025CD2374|nr:glycosyltransferase family 2 protein [uncultured Dialister sp.]